MRSNALHTCPSSDNCIALGQNVRDHGEHFESKVRSLRLLACPVLFEVVEYSMVMQFLVLDRSTVGILT